MHRNGIKNDLGHGDNRLRRDFATGKQSVTQRSSFGKIEMTKGASELDILLTV
jgi:hypothetical protein